jgi:DeoR/GlpR family transcriptional regulator of sugar metabolism
MDAQIPLGRRDLIAARLASGQAVVAVKLAEEFDVSEDAIRRDLRALAAAGLCRRVYGGALPITPSARPMAARVGEAGGRKSALGRAAVPFIEQGELVFLDNGSTNLALVDWLPEDHELTVATNSIDIAAAVLRRPDLRLLLVGGAVDPIVGGAIDAEAMLSVMRLNIDRCFLGACAVSAKQGVSALNEADASFKRALLGRSQTKVVLVTNDKFTAKAHYRVARLKQMTCFVVEHDVSSETLVTLKKTGSMIVTADRPS